MTSSQNYIDARLWQKRGQCVHRVSNNQTDMLDLQKFFHLISPPSFQCIRVRQPEEYRSCPRTMEHVIPPVIFQKPKYFSRVLPVNSEGEEEPHADLRPLEHFSLTTQGLKRCQCRWTMEVYQQRHMSLNTTILAGVCKMVAWVHCEVLTALLGDIATRTLLFQVRSSWLRFYSVRTWKHILMRT